MFHYQNMKNQKENGKVIESFKNMIKLTII